MTAISNSERQNDMNTVIKFLTGLIVLSALYACSAEAPDISDLTMFPGNIYGVVTDTDGNPVNHIKVTIIQSEAPVVVYTSSKGEFIAYTKLHEGKLNILLEDIDGAKNGGEFASLSDMITVLEDQADINLEYRLTRASSSESSQQL